MPLLFNEFWERLGQECNLSATGWPWDLPGEFWGPISPVGGGFGSLNHGNGHWKLRLGFFREIPFSVQPELQQRHNPVGLDPKVLHGSAGWSRAGLGTPNLPHQSVPAQSWFIWDISWFIWDIWVRVTQCHRSIPRCPLGFPCTPSPRQGIL